MIQTLINPDYFEIITLRDFVNNSKLKEGRLAFVLDEVHNIIPKTFMSKNRRGTKRKYEDGENDYDISEMDDLEETTIGRKKRYFDILKNTFRENISRIIIALSATPFSSDLTLERLTLKNTDAMHSFEICEQHVATHTFQALGRVCRIGSHNKPDDINENNFVYLFMYTVPMEKFQINMALNKENTFRNFFQQVKIRQNIIFQENKDKVIPVQQSFILSKNIESSLMYQNEKVPIAKINLDMKLYQSSSFIDLLSTIFNTSIYDFTCCNAVLNKLDNLSLRQN
ncbi:hypothetical protein PV328_012328 [Microctonus aethiopoides]|uniref:Uncharacterized protein n=1 Tax=Microctonus aethiopoides TaxID=144406 RepID=A0AA39FGQ2_9HYME|nr:hypothetical protein PV328_012328 [Microctonus aethiopoides]